MIRDLLSWTHPDPDGSAVIYELRIYTLYPGKQTEYLRYQKEVSRPIRGDQYGTLVGCWTTEFGTLNQYVHLWSYPDANERQRLRAALGKNERWATEYLAKTHAMVMQQQNMILSPVEAVPFTAPAAGQHLYELRSYRAHPGKLNEWVRLFTGILPTRRKYSSPVGLWTTDVGALNRAVHLWAYDDLNHRAEVRSTVLKDPAWQEFLAPSAAQLLEMNSTILVPAEVSPLQ